MKVKAFIIQAEMTSLVYVGPGQGQRYSSRHMDEQVIFRSNDGHPRVISAFLACRALVFLYVKFTNIV